MKEELFVFIDGERCQLDLPNPSGITLKWVSNLFNDISKLTCSYSYTFKLPLTSNNRRTLNMAEDVRVESGLTRKVIDAEFYINGICLCPNANLYISELTDTFSCVMTYKVLKGFTTLKDSGAKLTDLPFMGRIQWGGGEVYGDVSGSNSNTDNVLYPDYDAGVPHEAATPPKPVVPVYRIIQAINNAYGVNFDFGRLVDGDMGKKHKRLFNTLQDGQHVYDDFVSYGVIPLVGSQIIQDKYAIRGVYQASSHTIKNISLSYRQKWSVVQFGWGEFYVLHYGVSEGTYTGLQPSSDPGVSATYIAPRVMYVGLPVFGRLSGNEHIKPIYAFQHNTGLSYWNAKKSERERIDGILAGGYSGYYFWAHRVFSGVESVCTVIGTRMDSGWSTEARLEEDTTQGIGYSFGGSDAGKEIGIIGFTTKLAFIIKGSTTLRIAKAAVDAGRVNVSSYLWMSLCKVKSNTIELEACTDKDISEYAGFQSIDTPTYDSATDTYVCHFDFGQNYEARKVAVDGEDDEEFVGYVFLPYYPDDFLTTAYTTNENNEQVEDGLISTLQDGDMYFENFVISSIMPNVEEVTLPTTLNVVQNLPNVSCFDFMKSVFYMNGAMPRVGSDGQSILPMYYNQLRDRVNEGEAVDWSKKLLSDEDNLAASTKYHNTKFSQSNFLEMANSNREKTESELAERLDIFDNGYFNIDVEDKTLKEKTSVFKTVFHSAYIQNIRFPLIKVGRTIKVWEGDKTLAESVNPIYGVMVLRAINHNFEDVTVTRPGLSDIYKMHARMDIFSPFDDEGLQEKMFGYLRKILNNYQMIKEKFMLNEIDLRDFEESMPVYLSKYNSYFAVSTIQRDKDGICTAELIRLPRVEVDEDVIDESYEVEIISTGSISFDVGVDDSSDMYFQQVAKGAWTTPSVRTLNYGNNDYYAITADNNASNAPVLRIRATATGKYRFTYTDIDTGEKRTITREEANIYLDGNAWSYGDYFFAIYEGDQTWHRIKIEIPIRNQYGVIVERRYWESPYFVSSKNIVDYLPDEKHYMISDYSKIITLTIGFTYRGGLQGEIGNDLGTYGRSHNFLGSFEGNRLSPYRLDISDDQTYTLKYSVPSSLSYLVKEMVGANIISTSNLTVKLKAYYDERRILGEETLTFSRYDTTKYHIFKFIADLVNADGEVIERLRKKIYWFTTDIDASVITDDFGDEHTGDMSVKVNTINVSGDTRIYSYAEREYALSFLPTFPDVDVSTVQVTANVRSDVMTVSNVSKSGFALQVADLSENRSVTLTILATLEDNSTISKTFVVDIVALSLWIAGKSNFTSKDEEEWQFAFNTLSIDFVIKSITSSNANFGVINIRKVDAENGSHFGYFSLSTEGITETQSTTITIVVTHRGVDYSVSKEIKFSYRDQWSLQTLDEEGAMIVDRNGKFYTKTDWQNAGLEGADADGVAVSDGTHRFIIGKTEYNGSIGGYRETGYHWEGDTMVVDYEAILVSGQFTTESEAMAATDFNGKANTDAIIAQVSGTNVATMRNSQQFPSGIEAYLGTAGEWPVVQRFRAKVLELLTSIGATPLTVMNQNGTNAYWSSTQKNSKYEWYYYFGTDNVLRSGLKNCSYRIRPFAAVRTISTPIERGTITINGAASFQVSNKQGVANYTFVFGPEGRTVSEIAIVSSNDAFTISNVSVNGFTVTANNIVVDKVTTITVRARVNGLMETAQKTITAIGETAINYNKVDTEGVLIIDKDYNLYTEEEFYAANKLYADIDGLALSDGTHRFILGKEDVSTYEVYSASNVAIRDLANYDCEGNTLKIIAAESGDSAAKTARQYTFPSGEKGCLGTRGEWEIIEAKLTAVTRLLSVINADAISDYVSGYWTSSLTGTAPTSTAAWYWSGWVYEGEVEGIAMESRQARKYVRPFRKL